MLYLLPGMGATSEMYVGPWRTLPDGHFLEWPAIEPAFSLETLAQRVIDEAGRETHQRIEWLFTCALAREATDGEITIFSEAVRQWSTEFSAQPESARKLIGVGETPATDKYDATELATWTMAANLLMNMDEFVTKN